MATQLRMFEAGLSPDNALSAFYGKCVNVPGVARVLFYSSLLSKDIPADRELLVVLARDHPSFYLQEQGLLLDTCLGAEGKDLITRVFVASPREACVIVEGKDRYQSLNKYGRQIGEISYSSDGQISVIQGRSGLSEQQLLRLIEAVSRRAVETDLVTLQTQTVPIIQREGTYTHFVQKPRKSDLDR